MHASKGLEAPIVYLPDAFTRGRAISFATLLVLSVAIAVRRLRRTS